MVQEGNYKVFRNFHDLETANEFLASLKENGIDCKLDDNSPAGNVLFLESASQPEFQVLVKQTDFEAANNLLTEKAENLIDEVDKDHYLFDFTIDELYEIVMKPDEWSAFDYQLAQKILTDKGYSVTEDQLQSLREQRIEDLAKPELPNKFWILAGYVFAFLGGILGIGIGWYLWQYKKMLPDGQQVYVFNENGRKHGRNIFIFGLIMILIWLIVRFIVEM